MTTMSGSSSCCCNNPNDESNDDDNSSPAVVVMMKAAQKKEMLLREILPACQPQEGSPANTFTVSELQLLQAAYSTTDEDDDDDDNDNDDHNKNSKQVRSKEGTKDLVQLGEGVKNKLDIRGPWLSAPPVIQHSTADDSSSKKKNDNRNNSAISKAPADAFACEYDSLFPHKNNSPRRFREAVRAGAFCGPTNGACPGYLQCNLVVVPAGALAFDFLLFCQRNSKACPLLEVVVDGEGTTSSSFAPKQLAQGADLRTDLPKYVAAAGSWVVDCSSEFGVILHDDDDLTPTLLFFSSFPPPSIAYVTIDTPFTATASCAKK